MALTLSGIKDNIVASGHRYAAMPPSVQTPLKPALIASGTLHLAVLIIATIGLPFIVKDEPLIITPVSIELVDLADVTRTTRIAQPQKDKAIEKPEAPQPPKPKPAPQVTSEAPPDLTAPTPPKIETTPEKAAPPEPVLEAAKDKEQPKPKPKEKPKTQAKPAQQKDFASLLKNLAPEEEDQKQEQTDTPSDIETASGNIAQLADRLSISELDAFKRQIEPCWNVPMGAKYAEDLNVEIRVNLTRAGEVQQASVLDKGRYNRDGAFRAAADSAMRALRNPRCAPLKLPADKYEQWKTVVINFDPGSML
ncbi:MAG: energy transducer TonB [Bdellovibrionales bacterium]